MKHRSILLFLLTSALFGQPYWTGILDPTRAARWDMAGAYANPNTLPNWPVCTLTDNVNGYYTYVAGKGTTVNLISGSGNSATNRTRATAALTACNTANPTGTVVLLPASQVGTEFYMDGFCSPNYTVLRGAGAGQTMMHATDGNHCGGGGLAGWLGAEGPDSPTGGYQPTAPTHVVNWLGAGATQGTYAAGSTQLITDGAPSLVAGQWIVGDQTTDTKPPTDPTFIHTDEWVICAECANQAGSGAYMRTNRALTQWFQVVGSPINNGNGTYTITVTPPLRAPAFRTSQTPQIWYGNPNTMVHDVGIEDMSINAVDEGSIYQLVAFVYFYDCWEKGLRIYNNAAQQDFINARWGARATFESNYLYLKRSATSMSYGFLTMNADQIVIQNNICQQIATCWINASGGGNVFAHNYTIYDYYNPANWRQASDYSSHTVGSHMNLDEGNIMLAFYVDDIEGTSAGMNMYRSNPMGLQIGAAQPLCPILSFGGDRYHNIMASVSGSPGAFSIYSSYQDSQKNSTIYAIGINAFGSGGFEDPLALPTTMLWCNWDTYSRATVCNPAQVPTSAVLAANGLTKYSNPVPTSQYNLSTGGQMPPSMYLSGMPRWWSFPSGTASPWPAIGPDVTGGNVGVCTGTYAPNRALKAAQCSGGTLQDPSSSTVGYAGHVWANPAFNMYLNVMGGAPDGSGQPWGTAPPNGTPLTFDASGYYGTGAVSPAVTTITPPVTVGPTGASVSGNVTSDGGASVTARGTCYGASANPTTPCTSDGTGTGSFTSSLTGLSPNTLYHYRAFATNSAGTSYGSDQSFTTSGLGSGACVSGAIKYSGATSKK